MTRKNVKRLKKGGPGSAWGTRAAAGRSPDLRPRQPTAKARPVVVYRVVGAEAVETDSMLNAS